MRRQAISETESETDLEQSHLSIGVFSRHVKPSKTITIFALIDGMLPLQLAPGPQPTSPKHEYRRSTLRPPCDVIDDIIMMKSTFTGIIWDDRWACLGSN